MILNLFAFRSTWPNNLMFCADAVGPENDAALSAQLGAGRTIVCAWGNEPLCDRNRAESLGPRLFAVRRMLRDSGADVRAMSITSLGQPAHPLYLSSYLRPYPWQPAGCRLNY